MGTVSRSFIKCMEIIFDVWFDLCTKWEPEDRPDKRTNFAQQGEEGYGIRKDNYTFMHSLARGST